MRIKLFILGIVLGFVSLNSCNDDMGLVGPSMQPEEDIPTLYVDSFMIKASTVLIDSIYAKTSTALLGEFYDPLYGNLKSDYICQFYSEDGFKFEFEPIDGKIDSMSLALYYYRGFQGGWIGDSLTPMTATVYPVIKELTHNYYTNIDPTEFVDMQNPLGVQTYTARNLNVSDSLWNVTDSYGDLTYIANVKIRLPLELGQKFYDESENNPGSFSSQEAFNRFFPGIYITTTFGSGNMLLPSTTELEIYYRYYGENYLGEKDSVMYSTEFFPVTKEVIQMNRLKNTDINALLEPNDEFTYLKTPAGVFTRLTIPAKEILSKIEGRTVNNFHLSLQAMPQENWKYALAPPTYLLLVPEDSVQIFFENNQIENKVTSYVSYPYQWLSFSSTNSSYYKPYTYTFGNISNLLKSQAEKDPEKDLHMLVIPISRTPILNSSNADSGTSSVISHYLSPSGVRLRKDADMMWMEVVTSEIPDAK